MSNNSTQYDVVVIGAGAAGLMCAAQAGARERKVWLIDHAEKIGEKIRISGGGRCNFTNVNTAPDCFLSENKHFCKSALRGYTPQDFIALIERHGIKWHEKHLGQLFCDDSAVQIIDMLVSECDDADVRLDMGTEISEIAFADGRYNIHTTRGVAQCESVVIASGGLSIPKIGASNFGYRIAKQFGLNIVETRPALVPLTFSDGLLDHCKNISGLSVEAEVGYKKTRFTDGFLFTHRGLSGPSILQISSYWDVGQEIVIDLALGVEVFDLLKDGKTSHAKQEVQTVLGGIVPKRLAEQICETLKIKGRMADLPDKTLRLLADNVSSWRVKPNGTEGYRKAEVTVGGVDTADLSSKTMESKTQAGLYFIGEVVDVTGHLGGYNFQWAWASAVAAGRYI